eukprot:CAMPEP_0177640726 /NCGR_PEP_ID=MMETSP0447-20121125/6693_1 /TAXON_ID=0 /ORGANISM="Stygamoeba regulata, Strain BSH-02190019" /LENGTH=365 /DNA_ID=CAMNT_0019142809 /DNA_START=259 /DNA_END=1353 /DNA_ORIENTATION=-
MLSWIPGQAWTQERSSELGFYYVMRTSFSLFLFHTILAVFLIRVESSKDFRAKIQDGLWPIKLLFLAGIFTLSFFIPNDFFLLYAKISLVGASFFILVQLVMIVDFAHHWNESWLGNWDEKEENIIWYYGLLLSSLGLLILVVATSVAAYVLFCGSGCTFNTVVVSSNLIICAAFTALSLHPKVQNLARTGLLQSSVVAFYATFLIFSALARETGECNPFHQSTVLTTSSATVSSLFLIVFVLFSMVRTASSTAMFQDEEAPILLQEHTPLGFESEPNPDQEGNRQQPAARIADDEEERCTYNYCFFHSAFALGAMYIAMLITSWLDTRTEDSSSEFTTPLIDTGSTAMWVKIASAWVVSALYVW